jgi:hypothetical protein
MSSERFAYDAWPGAGQPGKRRFGAFQSFHDASQKFAGFLHKWLRILTSASRIVAEEIFGKGVVERTIRTSDTEL